MNAAYDIDGPRPHRYTVSDYYAMADHGILAHDARVELIDGEIIDMPPIGISHSTLVSFLTTRIARATGDDVVVSPQNPVRLSDFSEPLPDLAVIRPGDGGYPSAHPRADEVMLMIEVAHSSLRFDHDVKMPLYARHGVAVVWLIDVEARTLAVYAEPDGERYATVSVVPALDAVPLGVLDDVLVDLTGLFDRTAPG